MKRFQCVMWILLLLQSHAITQQIDPRASDAWPLEIGDRMPDIRITGIRNGGQPVMQFSVFSNELVLLDFWYGTCKGCIKSFPKLEYLQKKFAGKFRVLLVNFESTGKIDSVFSKWRKLSSAYKLPDLLSVTSDTVLHQLFSVTSYPHFVWIDNRGIIKAVTDETEVTEENIEAMIRGKAVKMEMKTDYILADPLKPMFPLLFEREPHKLQYYSTLFGFIPGFKSRASLKEITDTVLNVVRIVRYNMPVLQLFTDAVLYGQQFNYSDYRIGKRMILEVKDSARLFYQAGKGQSYPEWQRKNCYSYEAALPLSQKGNMFRYMLNDLERFFQLNCRVEKRTLPCLSLVRISAIDKIASTKKGLVRFDGRQDTTKFQIYKGFTGGLVESIARANSQSDFVFNDLTGYEGRVDIEFDRQLLNDIPALKQVLRIRYDLDLVEGEREIPVIVISEIARQK